MLAVRGTLHLHVHGVLHGQPQDADRLVTATASDDEGNPATAQRRRLHPITNVQPTIDVTKTPNPTSLPEPGGPVAFTFTVTNRSTLDPLTVTPLTDYGLRDPGRGRRLPGRDRPAHRCAAATFTQTFTVTGSAATGPHRDTFTAPGETTRTVP